LSPRNDVDDGALLLNKQTGNGFHATRVRSLESFNLFMWAKFVFGFLSIMEVIALLGFGSVPSSSSSMMSSHGDYGVHVAPYNEHLSWSDGWWSQMWPSVLYLGASGMIQCWSFINIRRLQATLWQIGYRNDEQFVPVGTSAASVGESSILALGRNLCK
jgi:hypothetical protein